MPKDQKKYHETVYQQNIEKTKKCQKKCQKEILQKKRRVV